MNSTKVITGKVRFSYVTVFEPRSVEEGGAPKYSVSIIISKKDKKTLEKINNAVEAAIEAGLSAFGGKRPRTLKLPLRDGDEERPDDEAYADSMFLTASSLRPPGIVDENRDEIMTEDEFYSGCYGRASINFFAFAKSSKGIAAGLNNLQKLEDGEPLGGSRASAEEDFADDEDDFAA